MRTEIIRRSPLKATATWSKRARDFYDEYLAVMDLTAEYYLQTVDLVFVKHALPKGEIVTIVSLETHF